MDLNKEPTDSEWEQAVELGMTKILFMDVCTLTIKEMVGSKTLHILDLTPGVAKALREMFGPNGWEKCIPSKYRENYLMNLPYPEKNN